MSFPSMLFQTLPGIILHFYLLLEAAEDRLRQGFQTLPGLFCIFYPARKDGGTHYGVSNPSGIILHFYKMRRSSAFFKGLQFQTLPGIILHFYPLSLTGLCWDEWFQTLPGIILHFYEDNVCPLETDGV